jgi:hypothetical protein
MIHKGTHHRTLGGHNRKNSLAVRNAGGSGYCEGVDSREIAFRYPVMSGIIQAGGNEKEPTLEIGNMRSEARRNRVSNCDLCPTISKTMA